MHSNFITPPDYVETVLVINATEEQVAELAATVKAGDKSYNIYFYREAMNDISWFHKISLKADAVLDAKINNPTEYFNK